jgi:hypothetical protein
MSARGSLRERWEAYQPTKTQAFWLVAIAIVATLIVGFGPGSWMTRGAADAIAAEASQKARTELAAVVCAEQFIADADAGARLRKLKEANRYDRDDMVSAGGWATMPDEKQPDLVVATRCGELLAEREAPVEAKLVTPAAMSDPAAK